MSAKRATRSTTKKPATRGGSKKTASRSSEKKQAADLHAGHDHDHDPDDEHVEFTLSKKTASAIDRALKGLGEAEQQRVLEAVDRVGEEAGETVGRWVEENVVANANELLAIMIPGMSGDGRWDEIRAIFKFLEHLDLPVDYERLNAEVRKANGAKLAKQYAEEIKPPNTAKTSKKTTRKTAKKAGGKKK